MNGHSWYNDRENTQGGKHMFIQIDTGIYEKLSEAEKGVIQFLNQNEEKIPYMSITYAYDCTMFDKQKLNDENFIRTHLCIVVAILIQNK